VSAGIKGILKSAVTVPLLLGSYYGGAGRLDLWPGYAYVAFLIAGGSSAYWLMKRSSPDLLEERAAAGQGAKRWDIPLVLWISILGPMCTCAAAGLDARFHGTPAADWTTLSGYALGLAGIAVTLAAIAANRFFSAVMRIQTDRGHAVASTGPYAVVRHPGYAGMLLLTAGAPLMLASTWASIPCAVTLAVIVLRTAMEDATLRRELPGYEEFIAQTRSRLIPGIW